MSVQGQKKDPTKVLRLYIGTSELESASSGLILTVKLCYCAPVVNISVCNMQTW